MHFLTSINGWFHNLNLRRKLACLVGLMSFFLLINGIVGFYIGYARIIPAIELLTILGVTILIILLVLPIISIVTVTITKPLRLLVDKMKQVASGNFDVEPEEGKRAQHFISQFQ